MKMGLSVSVCSFQYALPTTLQANPATLAGVEHSCPLQPSEMNAHTLKLTALAAIMSRLMANSPGENGWSPQAQDFLQDLTIKPVDKLMRVSSQHP
jgi:hypothetical protein